MRAFLIVAVVLSLASPVRADGGPILIPGTDVRLDRSGLAEVLRGADVVILGEVHDNPVHHLNQAWLIAHLRPAALVAEMLQQADEARIRDHLAAGGDPGGIGPLVGWAKSGWPDWEIYSPVFAGADGAVIAGAGMPRAQVRRVMSESAAALIDDARLKEVLRDPLAPALQDELEREMVDDHCGELPAAMAPMMVEAQRLRDASLAAAVLRVRSQAEGPVVVITGNGHARTDRGVPAMLARVAPDLRVVSVGQIENGDGVDAAAAPFDYVWLTEAHERPDPCEQLRRRKG